MTKTSHENSITSHENEEDMYKNNCSDKISIFILKERNLTPKFLPQNYLMFALYADVHCLRRPDS